MSRQRKAAETIRQTTEASFPTHLNNQLFKSVLQLTTLQEAQNFFRDLLTLSEIDEFSTRLLIAKLLLEGKSYLEIAKQSACSTTTVTRVAKWLFSGRNGYQTVLATRNKSRLN